MSAATAQKVTWRCGHDRSERRVRKDGSTACRACERARYARNAAGAKSKSATRVVLLAPIETAPVRLYTHEEWKAAFPDEWLRITRGATAPGALRIRENDDA